LHAVTHSKYVDVTYIICFSELYTTLKDLYCLRVLYFDMLVPGQNKTAIEAIFIGYLPHSWVYSVMACTATEQQLRFSCHMAYSEAIL